MLSLKEAMQECTKNNRVCLQPMYWNELYEMLPNKKRVGVGWEPSLPLILGAWWNTPQLFKQIRFSEHIKWANDHGCLDHVYSYLCSLNEENWYHFDD